MNKILILLIIFMNSACTTNKGSYWCGDHPCINKKEKEAYFKKYMTVEVRDIKKNSYKNNSEIEKLLKQAKADEKKRILSEKELAKQEKLKEKRRIKEEKELAKQVRLEEKRINKDKKNIIKNKKSKKLKLNEITENKQLTKKSIEFNELVEKIIKRNSLKPFPEINDIKN